MVSKGNSGAFTIKTEKDSAGKTHSYLPYLAGKIRAGTRAVAERFRQAIIYSSSGLYQTVCVDSWKLNAELGSPGGTSEK